MRASSEAAAAAISSQSSQLMKLWFLLLCVCPFQHEPLHQVEGTPGNAGVQRAQSITGWLRRLAVRAKYKCIVINIKPPALVA